MFTWVLGTHSLISTQTFRRALTASVDSCTEIKSGVTKSGKVWRKVPESDARWRKVPESDAPSVHMTLSGSRTCKVKACCLKCDSPVSHFGGKLGFFSDRHDLHLHVRPWHRYQPTTVAQISFTRHNHAKTL